MFMIHVVFFWTVWVGCLLIITCPWKIYRWSKLTIERLTYRTAKYQNGQPSAMRRFEPPGVSSISCERLVCVMVDMKQTTGRMFWLSRRFEELVFIGLIKGIMLGTFYQPIPLARATGIPLLLAVRFSGTAETYHLSKHAARHFHIHKVCGSVVKELRKCLTVSKDSCMC